MTLSPEQQAIRRRTVENLGLRTPESRTLADYWLTLAGGTLVPDKDDLDPAAVPAILPNLVIHQIETPDRIVIRLAGTAFYGFYGREITGANYLDMVDPQERSAASRRLCAIVDVPCGMLAIARATSRSGRIVEFESVGLPLRGRDGRVDHAIYANAWTGTEPSTSEASDATSAVSVRRHLHFDIGAGAP